MTYVSKQHTRNQIVSFPFSQRAVFEAGWKEIGNELLSRATSRYLEVLPGGLAGRSMFTFSSDDPGRGKTVFRSYTTGVPGDNSIFPFFLSLCRWPVHVFLLSWTTWLPGRAHRGLRNHPLPVFIPLCCLLSFGSSVWRFIAFVKLSAIACFHLEVFLLGGPVPFAH